MLVIRVPMPFVSTSGGLTYVGKFGQGQVGQMEEMEEGITLVYAPIPKVNEEPSEEKDIG